MKKKRRYRRFGTTPVRHLQAALGHLLVHPIRFAAYAVISAVLLSLVLTKSLPYALATANPDLALALNPNNPEALIAKAEELRAELLKASELTEQDGSSKAGLAGMNTIGELPKPADGPLSDPQSRVAALRMEIRGLAIRAIASDPLNAEAFRLRAETTADHDGARILMQEAARRSRRDAVTLFWLLNDSFYQNDFEAALGYADLLLRTHPALSSYVFNYLALIAEAPGGEPLLVKELATAPAWRVAFFGELPRYVKQSDTPLKLMQALKASGKPPVTKELAPYLSYLIGKNSVEDAYNAWLQFLPEDEIDTLGLLTHANFEKQPGGVPFDWQIARGRNAIAEIVPLESGSERALHVSFGPGRIQFPEVSQIVLLPAGKYRLTGKLKGSIAGKRGLRWQLRCVSGDRKVLGETEMLVGKSQEWRVFTLEADVPPASDCPGQELRLFHDSRTASEELLDGEAWFAALRLDRLSDTVSVSQ